MRAAMPLASAHERERAPLHTRNRGGEGGGGGRALGGGGAGDYAGSALEHGAYSGMRDLSGQSGERGGGGGGGERKARHASPHSNLVRGERELRELVAEELRHVLGCLEPLRPGGGGASDGRARGTTADGHLAHSFGIEELREVTMQTANLYVCSDRCDWCVCVCVCVRARWN
jgi:hypothetical protein